MVFLKTTIFKKWNRAKTTDCIGWHSACLSTSDLHERLHADLLPTYCTQHTSITTHYYICFGIYILSMNGKCVTHSSLSRDDEAAFVDATLDSFGKWEEHNQILTCPRTNLLVVARFFVVCSL